MSGKKSTTRCPRQRPGASERAGEAAANKVLRDADGLPLVVPLPRVGLVHRPITVQPLDVKSPDDLPSYLFLGDLEPDSFRDDGEQWSARYMDASPGTRLEITYQRATQLFVGCWNYFAQPQEDLPHDRFEKHGTTWQALVDPPPGFPYEWEEFARQEIEGWNWVTYRYEEQQKLPRMWAVPAGPLRTVLKPMHRRDVRKVVRAHHATPAESGIAVTLAADVYLGSSIVSYLVGARDDVPKTPAELHDLTVAQTGFAPLCEPWFEDLPDGKRILSVARRHYTYVALYTFRDIMRVVSHLRHHGVVERRCWRDGPGEEARSQVLRGHVLDGLARSLKMTIVDYDDAKTIRVRYEEVMPEWLRGRSVPELRGGELLELPGEIEGVTG
jgi:hypothetical protein